MTKEELRDGLEELKKELWDEIYDRHHNGEDLVELTYLFAQYMKVKDAYYTLLSMTREEEGKEK